MPTTLRLLNVNMGRSSNLILDVNVDAQFPILAPTMRQTWLSSATTFVLQLSTTTA